MLEDEKDPETIKNLKIIIDREESSTPKDNPWKGWEQKITDLIFKEYGEFAKGDFIDVWVEW